MSRPNYVSDVYAEQRQRRRTAERSTIAGR